MNLVITNPLAPRKITMLHLNPVISRLKNIRIQRGETKNYLVINEFDITLFLVMRFDYNNTNT